MFQSLYVKPVMKKRYRNAQCMHQLPFDRSEIQFGMWQCHLVGMFHCIAKLN
jgi:hypothetical protein